MDCCIDNGGQYDRGNCTEITDEHTESYGECLHQCEIEEQNIPEYHHTGEQGANGNLCSGAFILGAVLLSGIYIRREYI